jgi:hypothetical protein
MSRSVRRIPRISITRDYSEVSTGNRIGKSEGWRVESEGMGFVSLACWHTTPLDDATDSMYAARLSHVGYFSTRADSSVDPFKVIDEY